MEIGIEEVYREVAPKLMSYLEGNGCAYAVACDIVQETFLRLLNMGERVRGDMREVSGLAFAIARNYRNDLTRKAVRERSVEIPDEDDQKALPAAAYGRPGEEEEEIAVLRRRLRATLERMPVRLLETFTLSRLGKLSVKEIAAGTGASESNVKVRVHRARELFKSCFEDDVASRAVPGGSEESGESAVLRSNASVSWRCQFIGEIRDREVVANPAVRIVVDLCNLSDCDAYTELMRRSFQS